MRVNQGESDHPTPDSYARNNEPSESGDLRNHPPAQALLLKYPQDPPALIAVMGVTGSGKTTFVNQASGSYFKVGNDLDSCTSAVQESVEFVLDGRRVVLVDTPGFDDTCKSDTDVLKSIAAFLGVSYSAGAKLAGVIYMHRISDDRFGGLAAKNFRMFRELCGEKTLKNVVLMTNMWGRVTPQQGAERERQLKDKHFKAAIDKGAQLHRHTNTPESARAILRTILKNQPAALKIQQELIDEHKGIERTGAGEELRREIGEVMVKYKSNIRELDDGIRVAAMEEDEESREEMEEEKRRVEEEAEKLRKDFENMESKFEEARREMEERIRAKFEEQMRRMREEHEEDIRRREKLFEEERARRGEEREEDTRRYEKLLEEERARREEERAWREEERTRREEPGGWRCMIM